MPNFRNEAELLVEAHALLPKNNLVSGTSGNISLRVKQYGMDTVLIKPSGVKYDDLTPDKIVEFYKGVSYGDYDPSTDLKAHLIVYSNFDFINSIVHTHSPFATSFAIHGMTIPCCLTAMADEFGGSIPCSNYAKIGQEEVGLEILRMLTVRFSKAVLLRNHGVFTFGRTLDEAVKSAIMVEDVAKTIWASYQFGTPDSLPEDEIKRAHEYYNKFYGQEKKHDC